MLALKILGCVWVCVFLYFTVASFFQNDEKFGRYCWPTSLIVGLFFSTILPIMIVVDAVKNPEDPFSRLQYLRRSKNR
ncbi:hypothetical protein [Pseudomonas sp. PLMAX]|jgi:hypothetical protein|uniref:hypothetical protein n=1 Tax=Pseudomonas sp. PLMAX TaxID=2201998 RepID=UPI0038B74DC8